MINEGVDDIKFNSVIFLLTFWYSRLDGWGENLLYFV